LYARGKGRLPLEVVERVIILEREREQRNRDERATVAAFVRAFADLPPPLICAGVARVAVPGLDYDRRLFGVPPPPPPPATATLDYFSI
jgi:hypothetical protein